MFRLTTSVEISVLSSDVDRQFTKKKSNSVQAGVVDLLQELQKLLVLHDMAGSTSLKVTSD